VRVKKRKFPSPWPLSRKGERGEEKIEWRVEERKT